MERIVRFVSSSAAAAVLFLLLYSIVLHGFRLGAFEFFRHTEADRTLIAWEMAETGNYVVPHLLGSEIITKPPLFYWAIAASARLFGGFSEAAARVPSFAAALALVLVQFYFWRRRGGSTARALIAALFLSSGLLFCTLSDVAEIDMLFGLLCTVSLYLGFFAVEERSIPLTLVSYLAAAAAFLVKGPPIIFFYGASIGLYLLWRRRSLNLKRAFFAHFLGAAVFSLIVFAWLSMIASQLGWDALARQFDVEVVQRVIAPARQARGVFFYLGNLALGLLPWSLLFLVALGAAFKAEERRELLSALKTAKQEPLVVFSAITIGSALLMLTLAESKSSRYIFPAYPFAMNLAVFCLLFLHRLKWEEKLFKLASFLSAGAAALAAAAVIYLSFAMGASLPWGAVPGFAAVLASLAVVYVCATQRKPAELLTAVLLLMFSLRVIERTAFADYRNSTRSVKAVASQIAQTIPDDKPILTIEMFERWIVFYLKHLGRQSLRVSPALAAQLAKSDERVYLLLNADEEWWRVDQLRLHDPTLRLVRKFELGKDSPFLIEMSSNALPAIRPHYDFPTFPSAPYYTDAEKAVLGK